jgi:hypothetical protein
MKKLITQFNKKILMIAFMAALAMTMGGQRARRIMRASET